MERFVVRFVLMGMLCSLAGVSDAAYFSYDLDPDVDIDNPAAYTYDPLEGTGAFAYGTNGIIVVPGDNLLNPAGGWEVLLSGGSLLSLSEDATIDESSGTWVDSVGTGIWTSQTNYYGIRYDTGSGYGYGWLQIWNDNSRDVQLLASSFNDSGTISAGETSAPSAPTGAVPEPGSMMLLSLGLGGAGLVRRRLKNGFFSGLGTGKHHGGTGTPEAAPSGNRTDIYR